MSRILEGVVLKWTLQGRFEKPELNSNDSCVFGGDYDDL
jgi:hypothetical protein